MSPMVRPTPSIHRHNTAKLDVDGPSRHAGNGRLSRKDWILAGQDMLRKEGIAGLKLSALTATLGVSTGSFYHHFADFEQYLGAVAEFFSADRVQGVIDQTMIDNPDPVTRISRLAKLSLEDHTFELDAAMRIWATMDERAAVTVERSERLVLAFLAQAFEDLGFAPAEAALRARILLSVNIAPLRTSNEKGRRNYFRQALEVLVAPFSKA
jgi:AcrR family transcriptional regulator